MTEDLLLQATGILVLGVGAQWLAWRLRLPSILLLLTSGFVAGRVTGLLDPDELLGELLIPVVSLSVAVILFEGGLTLRLTDLPHVGGVVRNLIFAGGALTWALCALAAHLILGMEPSVAVLLGAILIVTGPTVITPLLEQVKPAGRTGAILRWEGIMIDPIGAMLAVLVFETMVAGEPGNTATSAATSVFLTLGVGAGFGAATAGAVTLFLRRYWVPDSLQSPVTLMFLLSAHTAANSIQDESGLFAAVVMGIVLANQKLATVEHIIEFKENVRVLLLSSLFIILSARLRFSDLTDQGLAALAFLAVLVLIARPAAVALSSLRSTLTWQERAFLAWVAPRGVVAASVASIFALRLAEAGRADADRLVPITFMVIVGTIAIYGLTAGPLAYRLKLASPKPQGLLILGAHEPGRQMASVLKTEGFDVVLVDNNRSNVVAARMAGLTAYHGNILSDQLVHEVDLAGIGRFLALTSNDAVNALACQRLSRLFGRAAVYQLPPKGNGGVRDDSVPRHQRGRPLFAPALTLERIFDRFKSGATVRATPLTEHFDYDDFTGRHGAEADLLFVITAARDLAIVSADRRPAPAPGDTVVSLLRETGRPAGDRGGKRQGRDQTPS